MVSLSQANALSDALRIKNLIQEKASIHYFYRSSYDRYTKWLETCPKEGLAIELGSGMGCVKDYISEVITTDIIPYPGLDMVLDATEMSYENETLSFICMLNVFHHISNVEKFLEEAQRCLKPKGKIHIIDQHAGFLGRLIFKWFHHESFEPEALDWNFNSQDPVNDANGALAWIVFQRDQAIFQERFPNLEIIEYCPHTPLYYWLSGGLKNWSLLSKNMISTATKFDKFISSLSLGANCFVDVVIEKN